MTKMRIAFHEARPDVELSWFLQHYKDCEFLVLVEPPVLTPMSLSVAEEWPISSAPWLRVRRVGWLDQKGRVWTEIPPSSEFDGGSLTPLLIQLEDKFEPPVLSRAAETLVKTKAMVEERLRGAKEREAQESTISAPRECPTSPDGKHRIPEGDELFDFCPRCGTPLSAPKESE